MTSDQMKARTKSFALRVIKHAEVLPRQAASRTIVNQIVRSATSVGANYRAACRAQSRATFAAKLAIVEEEADETLDWLELLSESGYVKAERLTDLIRETNEIVAIVTAARKTTQTRRPREDN
jgi:four helix bundle protein